MSEETDKIIGASVIQHTINDGAAEYLSWTKCTDQDGNVFYYRDLTKDLIGQPRENAVSALHYILNDDPAQYRDGCRYVEDPNEQSDGE